MGENHVIGIRYYSKICDNLLLQDCENQLKEYHVQIGKEDLNGRIIAGSLDFIDLDLIAINFAIIENFMLSGSYDIFKHILSNLWSSIRTQDVRNVPFTIRIEGIPTSNGPENISCKVSGEVSKKLQEQIITKTFELAHDIVNNEIELPVRGIFHDSFDAHAFNINQETLRVEAINLEEELKKKQ